jgi:hypothetical protein
VSQLLLLERVGGDLVREPDAASLLPQVEENAAPLLAQEPHAIFELLPAIAAPRAEDVSGEALRVQSNQDRLVLPDGPRLETGNERNVLFAVCRLVDEHPEATVGSW